MGRESIYKKLIKFLWKKLTSQMVKLGYGTIYMKSVIDMENEKVIFKNVI